MYRIKRVKKYRNAQFEDHITEKFISRLVFVIHVSIAAEPLIWSSSPKNGFRHHELFR